MLLLQIAEIPQAAHFSSSQVIVALSLSWVLLHLFYIFGSS